MSYTVGDFLAGKVTVDNVLINGTTIGHTSDTDLITLADGVVTVAGEISVTTLDIGGTNVSSTAAELNILDGVNSTAAELNILDGVTATAAEINIIDGDTSATGTTLADADRVIVNDGGTMKQVALTDFETYFESSIDTFSTIDINGGSIDGATVGAASASTGAFTNLTASGTLGVTGAVTANAGVVVDNITIDGTEIDLSSGDLLVDVAGDIYLDAAGGEIHFSASGGTGSTVGYLSMAANNLTLKNGVSDADIIFQGNDGGSAITALTLDMSNAGNDTINGTINATELRPSSHLVMNAADSQIIYLGAGNDLQLYHDGSNSYITNAVGALKVATETSGIAITIGHTTSETTVADNLTVTGNITATAGTTTLGHGVFDAGNVTMQLKNGNDNYYVWRNLDSTNDLDLRYNSTQLFAYDSSTTKWDWRGAHTVSESALTDGSTAVNAGTTNNFTLLLEENTTIGAPSNASAGQVLVFEISQHSSSGPYTLAWNSVFEFAASTAPTMTATDNKCDIFTFRYNGSKWQEIGRSQNMAVS